MARPRAKTHSQQGHPSAPPCKAQSTDAPRADVRGVQHRGAGVVGTVDETAVLPCNENARPAATIQEGGAKGSGQLTEIEPDPCPPSLQKKNQKSLRQMLRLAEL